ncbi:hypothetical protein [Nitrosopumilus sp.]|uniref:hypothetical protein n=1 Tax=Nitrosopumilus sp. TaxID=2024843 RepID=UPI00263143D9|nr:hypothetical protein [Nitrosopumilus sp.]
MVLPLVDEHKPKCYLCHKGFENLEEMRECLDNCRKENKDFFEPSENEMKREPAPGDVTVF